MSKIINTENGYIIDEVDYTTNLAQDMYNRFAIESSVLPCIFSGLNVTSSGLSVTISSGYARGQNINISGITSPVPSNVYLQQNTILVPPEISGFILLPVNIQAVDDTNQVWSVGVSSIDPGVDNVPVFSQTIIAPNISSYPYAVIPLAFITTNATSVTSINTDIRSGMRAFDFTNFFLPTFSNAPNGYRILNNSGYVIQWGSFPAPGRNPTTVNVTFPIPMNPLSVVYNEVFGLGDIGGLYALGLLGSLRQDGFSLIQKLDAGTLNVFTPIITWRADGYTI